MKNQYKCIYCKKEFKTLGEVYNHYYETWKNNINVMKINRDD